MSRQDPTVGRRLTAALVMAALAWITLPSLGLAVSSAAELLEDCQACAGCEDGSCDESSPFDSGDHCCLSSCMAHAVWALSASPAAGCFQRCEAIVQGDLERPLQAVPSDIYQPPRS